MHKATESIPLNYTFKVSERRARVCTVRWTNAAICGLGGLYESPG